MYTLAERARNGLLLDAMQLGSAREAFRLYAGATRFYRRLFLEGDDYVRRVRECAGGLPPMCASPFSARTVALICGSSELDPWKGPVTYTYVVTHPYA